MYDTARDLVDALAATPDVFRAVLAGVDPGLARRARGGDEGWSVVQVACHLRDAEERALERARAMRDEDEPALPGYDQDAWAIERRYAEDDLGRALDAFFAFRAEHLAFLRALAPAAWARSGIHAEQGRITIEAHTVHLVSHDAQHLAQVVRALDGAR